MKTTLCLVTCLAGLALTAAFGQQPPRPAPTAPATPHRQTPTIDPATGLPLPAPSLTRFSLDFPGGTPKELVAAIQGALQKAAGPSAVVNAIVPDDYNDIRLPALKMNDVNISELFQALEAASRKSEAYVTGQTFGGGGRFPNTSYQIANTAYGFSTTGQPSDSSIWYFHVDKPALPPAPPEPPTAPPAERVCRFYSLAPYLDRGLKVDDITTAIETGWKMLGLGNAAQISFHKDTKLLIAVGPASNLETIDSVLRALQPSPPSFEERLKALQPSALQPAMPPSALRPPSAKPAEKSKE